jgi:NAD(P)-dependent dehydrogenase (short-subunit alcohol dehydrogenase family)
VSVLDAFSLDDRTAVVTGGNRGIGRAIARALAEAGADVVVANRDEEAGERAASAVAEATGVETAAIPVDVADESSVCELMDRTVERFGGVDVLVNNAGITRNVPAEAMDAEDWHDVLDVNLTGVFFCSKHCGRAMIEAGGGVIVNVSSVSASFANHPQPQVGYNASKGGVEAFTRQLASEWADHGIRVNAIDPGYIRTAMIDDVFETNPEMAATWKSRMLVDEIPGPEALGPLAVFLASDASAYMTGASVVIDGGYTVR